MQDNEVKRFFDNLKDPYAISCRTLCDQLKMNYSKTAAEFDVSHTTVQNIVNWGHGDEEIKKLLCQKINFILSKNGVDVQYTPDHFWPVPVKN